MTTMKTTALHLDTVQEDTLREILDAAWRDLLFEIADSTSGEFTARLRARERVVVSLLEQLPAPVPSADAAAPPAG